MPRQIAFKGESSLSPPPVQVATLTRYLQATNEDLMSTQRAVEMLETSAATLFPPDRLDSLPPTMFRTAVHSDSKLATLQRGMPSAV